MEPVSPPAPSPDAVPLTAPARGLHLLTLAFAANLVASIVGGALRTHYVSLIFSHEAHGTVGTGLSMLLGGWQLIYFATSVMMLVGLAWLGKAPPESRVAGAAQPALVLSAVSLGLSVLQTAGVRFASSLDPHTYSQILMTVGYIDTAIDFVGMLFLFEAVLRLRRWAAPTVAAENETVLRGALIGLLVARILGTYASYMLPPLLFNAWGSANSQWVGYVIRLPLGIAFSGLLLWVLQATAKAVAAGRPADAPGAVAAAPATGALDAGYRNLIFGAVWAIGGTAVTLLTYGAASSGGGRYVIAYGAIIAGVAQFIRGLTQVLGRR